MLSTHTNADETQVIRILLIGDSTMTDEHGWGGAIGKFFKPNVKIINRAVNGASSKSYLDRGFLERALAEKPHYVFIQFGHNDCPSKVHPECDTDPNSTYMDYLRIYIKEFRQIGTKPILICPMARRRLDENGKIVCILGAYADAAKRVGMETHVPVIDLHSRSIELYERLGETAGAELQPQGDRTHFNAKGAMALSELIAGEIPKVDMKLAKMLDSRAAPITGKNPAKNEPKEISTVTLSNNFSFDPVRYRPMAKKTAGLRTNEQLLDGAWRINPEPPANAVGEPMDGVGWGDLNVPGQWYQQGYDVPKGWMDKGNFEQPEDEPVAIAKQFMIPRQWAGYRIFLRFDAIHGGTRYWLNGQELGYSEALFVPIEWEITDMALPGRQNRLDLRMTVKTASERFSIASGYAHHNLGGIDRSVRIYALPQIHVQDLRIDTDLDAAYRDADLRLKFTLENPLDETCKGLTLRVLLTDPRSKGKKVNEETVDIAPLKKGAQTLEAVVHVPNPLKWNAEQPNLYDLVLELQKNGELLERIERQVGFREIEVRGSLLYVNGISVKLAGACRHEIDPLSGRADTMRHAEQDVKLLKAANLNYIRTSHYPPTQELADAADRLGMYLEVEAPFCWVGGLAPHWSIVDPENPDHLRSVMTPISAMIDYFQAHPSVIIWSIANESIRNNAFDMANSLCKQIDPSRPTTFNSTGAFFDSRKCDIGNSHYPPMPYDEHMKDDPRPLLLGEYFFPICHEMTDVDINPGLRELWSHGHSNPSSEWAKQCAVSFDQPILKPGTKPGAWSHIYHSKRVIGGAIFAAIDDTFYFPNGEGRGYSFESGYWGLLDAWRRPKPEWWFSKLIFSPVWFLAREVPYSPGQTSVFIPVENRYAFTDFNNLNFDWEMGNRKGKLKASLPPSTQGEIKIPIPKGANEGEQLIVRAFDKSGELVNAATIQLGNKQPRLLPEPQAGVPRLRDNGKKAVIEGNGFSLVFDRSTGNFDASHPKHQAPVIRFPRLHITEYDFGDLAGFRGGLRQLVEFPDAKTRGIESVSIEKQSNGLEITVRERYADFSGGMSWLIDANGMGKISYDYTYTGKEIQTREAGVKLLLSSECDKVKWRRWSEWGDIYPQDQIGRTEGFAKAHRPKRWGKEEWNKRPAWPWSLDETELGTNDFRSMKFNIYEASLLAPDGSGVQVHANADVHLRPALSEAGVKMHIISRCWLGQVLLKPGDRLQGSYVVEILNSH